jgi:hypothetical protein
MYLTTKILLVNLTSAVYISHSGYTLTFGAKSESSLAYSPFVGADGDEVQDRTIQAFALSHGGRGCSESDVLALNTRDFGVLCGECVRGAGLCGNHVNNRQVPWSNAKHRVYL